MSVAERHLNSSQAPDEIAIAREKIREGNHAAALQALAQAKALDPRNIFLIALEKQVSRLKNGGILPRERAEIVESLESLFERVLADGPTRPAAGGPPTVSMPAAGERKDLRLKLVVDQYFKHADEWIQRGDFEAAAKEIERVLLIDPQNRVAKEYQTRVQQLLTADPVHAAVEEERALPLPSGPVPASHTHAAPAPVPAPVNEKKGGRLWLMIGVGVLLIGVIVGGVFLLRPHRQQYKPGMMYVVQLPAPPAGEQGIVPTTAENVPVIKDEPASEPGSTPAITPPGPVTAPVKGNEKGTEKGSDRGTEKPLDKSGEKPGEKPGEKLAEKGAENKAPDAAKSEPVKKLAAESSVVTPPVVENKPPAESKPAAEEPAEASRPFIPIEQAPRIINLVQPEFTTDQARKGIVGDIVVKVQIDETGKPLQAKVISSTNPDLNDPVITAVMSSTYAPGVMSSGPVTTWMSIPLKLK